MNAKASQLRIAVLANHEDSETVMYARDFARREGHISNIFGAYKGELPDPDEWDGIIAAGSDYNVRDLRDKEWIQKEMIFFKNLKKPLLAICFAHQLLAESFGGLSDKAKSYKIIDGALKITLDEQNPLFFNLPNEIWVAEEHGDEIIEIPEGFRIIAHSQKVRIEGMMHTMLPLYSVQFHPEWENKMQEQYRTNEFGFTILRNFFNIVENYKLNLKQ